MPKIEHREIPRRSDIFSLETEMEPRIDTNEHQFTGDEDGPAAPLMGELPSSRMSLRIKEIIRVNLCPFVVLG